MFIHNNFLNYFNQVPKCKYECCNNVPYIKFVFFIFDNSFKLQCNLIPQKTEIS